MQFLPTTIAHPLPFCFPELDSSLLVATSHSSSLFLKLYLSNPLTYHSFHGAFNLSLSFYLFFTSSFVVLDFLSSHFPLFFSCSPLLYNFFIHSASIFLFLMALLAVSIHNSFLSPPVLCTWVCSYPGKAPTLNTHIWLAVCLLFSAFPIPTLPFHPYKTVALTTQSNIIISVLKSPLKLLSPVLPNCFIALITVIITEPHTQILPYFDRFKIFIPRSNPSFQIYLFFIVK